MYKKYIYIYLSRDLLVISINSWVRIGFAHIFQCSQTQHNSLRKSAQRLATKAGLIICCNNKPGKHIEFNHPSLIRLREYIQLQVTSGGVEPRLICNFDQTWCLNFIPRRGTLQVSQGSGDFKSIHTRRLRHRIQRAMGIDFDESMAEPEEVPIRQPDVKGGKVAHNPVEGYRIPHSLTTLSWVDGTMSRGYVTIRSDHMSDKIRLQLNEVGVWGGSGA